MYEYIKQLYTKTKDEKKNKHFNGFIIIENLFCKIIKFNRNIVQSRSSWNGKHSF